MDSETKICQNCKQEFTIDSEDFNFYEKIKVLPPTFCPRCRFQRRLMQRNERNLYSRTCSGSGKKIISYYEAGVSFPVYSREFWYSDAWDGTVYGRDYNFNKPFFEQFKELGKVAPRIQLWQVNSVNSEYSNYIGDSKNCYLCFTAFGANEDCKYSTYLTGTINCLDCDHVIKCERCYECFNCDTCYNCQYCVDSINCRDSFFLADCSNCVDCFGCVGLRDKQYCIWNKTYTKEEYQKEISTLKIPSRQNIALFKEKLEKMWLVFPRRYMHGRKNQNVSGDYVSNSNNCQDAFFANNCDGVKNTFFTLALRNSMDVLVSTLGNELLYECHAVPKQNYNIRFSDLISNGCREIEYSSNCDACSNLFGCIGLRKKEYCILNKQYDKEEYFELVEKIKKHMSEMPYIDSAGRIYRYGEFLSADSSPFTYNESMAQEHFPLNPKEVKAMGWLWKEPKEKNYQVEILPLNLPDDPKQTTAEMAGKVIGCLNEGKGNHNCTTAFRILPDELQFYIQGNIPLPMYCPNCRYHQRISQRNPMKLWIRKCQCNGKNSKDNSYKNTVQHLHQGICSNEFETSYAPDRQEIVYCEKCYQQEVY